MNYNSTYRTMANTPGLGRMLVGELAYLLLLALLVFGLVTLFSRAMGN